MGHRHIIILFFAMFVFLAVASAQEADTIRVGNYTRQQIKKMTQEELLDLSLEELMMLVKKLKLSSIDELYRMVLNPVVKSASKKEEQSFASPLSVTVITREELQHSGALNIPEALRLAPGIIVRQKTNGNYDVHIRGNDNVPPGNYLFDSENTISLVMIDNRPVYNNFQGGIFWEALPIDIEDIKKIEVVTGPATALYGPNAVTGAINIITLKPGAEELEIHGDVQYGNANTRKAYVGVNKDLTQRLSARLSANYQQRDRFQDEYLNFSDYEYYPSDSLSGIISNAPERYEDPMLAINNQGLNFATRYDDNKELLLDFAAGIQQSKIQTIYLDINNLSLTRRESKMKYLNFKGQWHNLKAMVAYDKGLQDNAVGFYGYKFDIGNFSSLIEYDFTTGIFTLSPGISFSKSVFNDKPHLQDTTAKTGLFNQQVNLTDKAYYIRSEINPSEDLRLIAAIRLDDYNLPEDDYWSYQFVTSYTIGAKSHMRLVYSRANRGPFMYDFHVDHRSELTNNEGYTEIERFIPNKELDLVKMDMLEFGFRHRIRKNMLTDFSFFYHKAHDFSNNITTSDTTGQTIQFRSTIENTDLISRQLGVTMRFSYVMSKKFSVKFFTTGQLTALENLNLDYVSGAGDNQTLITIESDFLHKTTPSLFGGLIVNYAPAERWNINTNFYRYGKQEFFTVDGITDIESKTIMNIKASYRFYKNNTIYFNARNFLDNGSYEFPFADEARGLYLIGLNMNL